MGCYCGCDTQANRVKWAVAAVLFTLAWVCATVTSAIESSCYQENPDAMGCLIDDTSRSDCQEQKEALTECIKVKLPVFGLVALAFVVLFISAPVPLCMMCCCGQPPQTAQAPSSVRVGSPVYAAPEASQGGDSQQPLLVV